MVPSRDSSPLPTVCIEIEVPLVFGTKPTTALCEETVRRIWEQKGANQSSIGGFTLTVMRSDTSWTLSCVGWVQLAQRLRYFRSVQLIHIVAYCLRSYSSSHKTDVTGFDTPKGHFQG